MDAWTRVIVEWVNCLGIIESSIEDVQDLHDGIFYKKLISQLSRGNEEIFTGSAIKTIDGKELVSKFIEAEYPEFHRIDNDSIAIPENLYIASLLLVQCSQQPTFHRPMCSVLKHETQIQVKRFLELVLPHGKKISRESIATAIAEIGDVASEDCPKTPTIRPLREFFNSPAVRSVRSQRFMNDRNRELIVLKAQLETERFEKLDLRQDLKVQEERIQNMQKKLEEKSRELRDLRNEKVRPVTPKSCRKKRSSNNEERLMRDIEKLETTNFNLLVEIEKLRDEREEITRQATSDSRAYSSLKQKLEVMEKNFDIVSGQLEIKENEILDLRMNCEELREHIHQISRSEIKDESFDIEPTEALSSIVDIQLQEARKESSQLIVQLENLKNKFDDEKKTSCDLENLLREKSAELVEMKTLLMETKSQLELAEKKSLSFEIENARLIEEVKKINVLVESKEQLVYNLEILLKNENSRVSDLESMITACKNEAQDLENVLMRKDEELINEKKEAAKILIEKTNLSKELGKCVESIEDFKEKIAKTEHECQISEEKLQQEFEKTEKLRKREIDLEKKLIEEQNKMAAILSKNTNLEEELSSYVQSAVDQKRLEAEFQEATLKIHNLEILLKTENSRVSDLESMITSCKNEAQDLKNVLMRKDEELISEKKEAAKILIEKTNLSKELGKCVESIEDFKEKIAKTEHECQISEEKLQQEFEKTEKLRKREIDLEKKLIEEQNKMAAILSKNTNLEEELSSYVQSAVDQKRLEAEFQEATLKIHNLEILLKTENSRVSDLESMITSCKNEAQDLKNVLMRKDEELISEKKEAAKILIEKTNLSKELGKCVESIEDFKEKIAKTEHECQISEEKLQQEFEKTEKLRKREIDLEKKLIEEQNKMAAIVSKNTNLEEELSSYVQSAVDQKRLEAEFQEATLKIHNLEILLKTENSRVSDLESMITTCKNEAQDLKNVLMRKDEELIGEKNEAAKILTEKTNLSKELNKYVEMIENLKEKIAIIDHEHATSEEKLQQELEKNEKLRKRVIDLDEKLIEEQNKMAAILNKNINLEEQLSSYVQSTADQREKIANLEDKLEKTSKNLQDQAELKRFGEKLEDELAQQRNECQVLEKERNRLAMELSNSSGSVAEMAENITALHAQLELSHKELQKLRELGEIDRERLKSENAILVKDLNEKIRNLTDLITLLENKLCNVEKSCEETKIEEKSKTAALQVVREKYDELSRDKIESELRMKELILNLQEVRASQDEVLRAQTEALQKDAVQLVESEKELERLKSHLIEKTSEVVNEKAIAENQRIEFERLRETNLTKERLVKELQEFLDVERQEVREKTKCCETLRTQMVEIEQVSRSLKTELNALWASIRDACPELARNEKSEIDQKVEADIIHTVASFAEDARTICKAVSILSEANETLKEHLDGEKEIRKNSAEETEKHKLELESEVAKCNLRFSLLAQRNKNMQELLSRTIVEREKIEEELENSTERWKILVNEAEQFLTTGGSDCDELKHLRVEKNCLDDLLTNLNGRRSSNTKKLLKTLCEIFLWSETKLHEAQDFSIKIKPGTPPSEEEDLLKPEIRENKKMCEDLKIVGERMGEFSKSLKSYEASVKSGIIKRESTTEEKLKIAFDKLTKERNEMKEKLEAVRIRNVKMEKNMDELRSENKKLKAEACENSVDKLEVERMKEEIDRLKEESEVLKRNTVDGKEVDTRLEEVHNEYGLKLDKIKQKMKTAYNEQIAKLNQEQERAIKEKIEALRLQTEAQCRKYTEDIAKYKTHISDLTSRYWDVGEKLLAETQEKNAALLQLQRLKGQQQQQQRGEIAEVNERTSMAPSLQKTASLDRRDFIADRATREPPERSSSRAVEVIEEEITTFHTRRHKMMSIQAMGNAFNAEDEEGEVFDSVYLADLKEGRFPPIAPDLHRLSELKMRNSMCRPHLKSSYAVETNLQPVALNEDDIKNGVPGDDVFNDSLSQSLLPGQKPKRKDRTQTSYKKPGPPTPSKNGGRLSLQGNELKSPSSRILKERNVERRTTATPRGLKNLFGNSLSKRQDENTNTPKGRRLSNIFRKQRN